VKRCVKCTKEIPDSALHCVFCGERQPAQPVTGANTVMGYPAVADEIIAQAGAAAARPAVSAVTPGAPASPTASPNAATMIAPAVATPAAPTAERRPAFPRVPKQAGATQRAPYNPDAAGAGAGAADPSPPAPTTPAASGGIVASGGPPPMSRPSPRTDPSLVALRRQRATPSDPVEGSPGQGAQSPASPPAPVPAYPAAPATDLPATVTDRRAAVEASAGAAAKGARDPTESGLRRIAERPPYLASETGTRMNAPVDPWAQALTRMMVGFGVLLLCTLIVPWRVGGGHVTFSWDVVESGRGMTRLAPILFVASGLLALSAAVAPLGVGARGVAAAGVGLVGCVFAALAEPVGIAVGGAMWRLVGVAGLVSLVTGLMIRSQYRAARLGRVLATIGAAAIAALYLIPVDGRAPIASMFEQLASAPPALKAMALYLFVPFALALVAMVVWMPAPSSAGAAWLAWALILWTPLALVLMLVVTAVGTGRGAELVKQNLVALYHLPVAVLAWIALAAHGLATLAGKRLEHV
jgi:hypothetical protein